MSVTTIPRTASPRNSRRSLFAGRSFSKAWERCVSASCRIDASRKRTSRIRSSAFGPSAPRSRATRLLDLDGLSAGVVAAVAAHAVGQLRLVALRTLGVRGRLRLRVGLALRGAGVALVSLGNRHGSSPSRVSAAGLAGVAPVGGGVEQDLEGRPARVGRLVARALAQVAVTATVLAQPEAVGPAQRRERHEIG